MDKRPSKPGYQPANLHLVTLQNRKVLADYGHVAFVEVRKRTRRRFTCDAAVKELSRITSLLHGDLCNPGKWLAILFKRGGISNHEDLRVAKHTEISLNAHPAGTIGFHVEPFSCRRGSHTRGPDYGLARDALPRYHNPVSVNSIHAMPEPYLDPQVLQPSLRGCRKIFRESRQYPWRQIDEDNSCRGRIDPPEH